MKRVTLLFLGSLLTPLFTYAAETSTVSGPGLQSFIQNVLIFSNTVLLPFILGIAFLFVVINAVRLFVIEGANEKSHDQAKRFATYSVLAFVVIIVFWGVVNLFATSLGFAGQKAPTADYLETYGGAKEKAAPTNSPSVTPNQPNPSANTPATTVTCILPPDGHSERLSLENCRTKGGVAY